MRAAILHPFWAKVFKPETTSFITFPQGFRKFKKFGHWTSGSERKKSLNKLNQWKKSLKNFFRCGNFTPFMSNFFSPLLFPNDSGNLKSLNIGFWKGGAKRPLNGVRKCGGQKDTLTQIRTFWLIERIYPKGWFFENMINMLP